MKEEFEYTGEGCKKAKTYLIDNGLEYVLTSGFSTDGWSIVYAANEHIMKGNKKYDIWIGNYHIGQGSTPPNKPEHIDTVIAPNFKVACVLHELRSTLSSIENSMEKGQYVDHQTCRNFYDFDTNTNSWTGKYFETKKEALKTFELKQ